MVRRNILHLRNSIFQLLCQPIKPPKTAVIAVFDQMACPLSNSLSTLLNIFSNRISTFSSLGYES